MAELVLSALLPVLFEKLTSATFNRIARYKGIEAEIKKWHRSLTQIQGLLTDASQKEITNQAVKRWLNDLQHLAYDIDDVLDDLSTDAMHREFTHESEDITSKVRKLIPSCCTNFPRNTKMLDELDGINAKLQELLKEKADLGLIVIEEPRPRNNNNNNNNNRRFQSSVVDPSRIVGRKAEKEALVQQLLLADGSSHQKFGIVPIVGMGGVGKTTLARLLYDDHRVKDQFDLRGWVCISDDFDIFGRTKDIFTAMEGELKKELENFNKLHEALKDHISGKRFLLVLDDVWCESYTDWDTLVTPLCTCAPGSKIIITTRNDQLVKQLVYNPLNKQLQTLSDDDALSLVALHALDKNNFDSHLSLKPHAEGIVRKCGNLPLALIALGRLLRTKNDEEEHWKDVSNSDIWRLKDGGGILPALRVSYNYLSAPLKQLFAYCSLFPKDFLFDKEELVLLWMAEGFLHHPTSSVLTNECLGREHFEELLSRSFFEHAPNNESLFVMHDLMNDLATSVSTEFFLRLHNENEENLRREMPEKYRHMSFVREKYVAYKNFEALKKAKSLRTFLAMPIGVVDEMQFFYLSNKILVDILPKLPTLRVLSLSNFQISEVPESIGTLRHLRYLNLSRTRITHLPENVCNLYNLQTLILSGCLWLSKLPNSFLKLKNLRHLDIRNTQVLDCMPLGIGELKNLQTLSKIIIEGESGFEITKLKGLKNLCGDTSVVCLDKVQNATHAREANFSQKRFTNLELAWSLNIYNSRSDGPHGSQNEIFEKTVLNELKPCNDKLMKLKIGSYRGLDFPNWVGDHSFLHLKHVTLLNCDRCTTIPPLGQLPSLKELFIEGLDKVKVVGMEFLGTSHAFPSLEILRFEHMHGWKKWLTNNTMIVFPCLKELLIRDCLNLVEVTLGVLPLLNVLSIFKCNGGLLRSLVQVSPALTVLLLYNIIGLNNVVWGDVIQYLRGVEELSVEVCNDITYLWKSESAVSKVFVKLRSLNVRRCDNLVSLGEEEKVEDNCRSNFLTSLRILEVVSCGNMKCFGCPGNIETLKLYDCYSIPAISLRGLHKLKSLEISSCDRLLECKWEGESMNNISNNMPMLESVTILACKILKSFINVNYLVHLTELSIERCESMEPFPDTELPNLTSLKKLTITDFPNMDACFPRGFWPPKLHSLAIGKLKKPISEWAPQNFPTSLVELRLYCEDSVDSCSQFSHILPSSLTFLEIEEFEKLESVSMGLQHLNSLQHLTFSLCPNLYTFSHSQHLISLQHICIYKCPKMMDLPEDLLPSLLSLTIGPGCPKLKERCSKGGSYWPLISHIPYINIY